MSLYSHIAVGTDFSKNAEPAVNKAISFALANADQLSIVHIIDNLAKLYQEVLPLSSAELETMLLQEAKRKLFEDYNNDTIEFFDSIQMNTYAIVNKPVQGLLEFCDTKDVDLLIVGQRSSQLLKRILLGSTAEQILYHSRAHTMIVHPDVPDVCKRILVPVDFSNVSRYILSHACALAEKNDIELHLLHVYQAFSPYVIPTDDDLTSQNEHSINRNESIKKYDDFVESFDFQGLHFSQHLREGKPSEEIIQAAIELNCDLILMGSVSCSTLRHVILGSTIERVARKLPCSLLTIKPPHQDSSSSNVR